MPGQRHWCTTYRLLYYCCTASLLLLYYCVISVGLPRFLPGPLVSVELVLCYCFTTALLLLYYCSTTALLLLYYCFTYNLLLLWLSLRPLPSRLHWYGLSYWISYCEVKHQYSSKAVVKQQAGAIRAAGRSALLLYFTAVLPLYYCLGQQGALLYCCTLLLYCRFTTAQGSRALCFTAVLLLLYCRFTTA